MIIYLEAPLKKSIKRSKPNTYPGKQIVTYLNFRWGKKGRNSGKCKFSALSQRQLDNKCCSNIPEITYIAIVKIFNFNSGENRREYKSQRNRVWFMTSIISIYQLTL